MITDLNNQKHTCILTSKEYNDTFHFSANMDASFLNTVVANGSMPPLAVVAENTYGEKQVFSTSFTLSS